MPSFGETNRTDKVERRPGRRSSRCRQTSAPQAFFAAAAWMTNWFQRPYRCERSAYGPCYSVFRMFSRQHRKARVLFGLSDVLLAALAFEAAYQTRVLLHLERAFYLTVERKALVLAFALAAWVTIGLWLEVYEKLDIGHPRVILRDAARQCAYGALCLIVFEYVLRLDLSRPFLVLFSIYAWVLLLLFRLTAGRVVG